MKLWHCQCWPKASPADTSNWPYLLLGILPSWVWIDGTVLFFIAFDMLLAKLPNAIMNGRIWLGGPQEQRNPIAGSLFESNCAVEGKSQKDHRRMLQQRIVFILLIQFLSKTAKDRTSAMVATVVAVITTENAIKATAAIIKPRRLHQSLFLSSSLQWQQLLLALLPL